MSKFRTPYVFLSVLCIMAICIDANARNRRSISYEKVFVATDKAAYAPGTTMLVRGYVSDDSGEEPSRYLYVDLLNKSSMTDESFSPMVLGWAKIASRDGIFEGKINVPSSVKEGTYVLRAYTKAQKDIPSSYLFHKDIVIAEGRIDEKQVEERTASELEQAETLWAGLERSDYEQGEREMVQQIAFSVSTLKRKLPDEYTIGIMSQDAGFYASYKVASGQIQNPDEFAGACLTIANEGNTSRKTCRFVLSMPDFKDGASFAIILSGSKYIWPSVESNEFAPYFNYGSEKGMESVNGTEIILSDNESRLNAMIEAEEIKTDSLVPLIVSVERKKAFLNRAYPHFNIFDARTAILREDLQHYDGVDLFSFISNRLGNVKSSWSDIASNWFVLHAEDQHPGMSAQYMPAIVYIDGALGDWSQLISLKVADVENLALLNHFGPVVVIELRKNGKQSLSENGGYNNALTFKPVGVQD